MDFTLYPHGSITLLDPLTAPAKAWCEDHLPADCARMGGSFAIETNHIQPIIEGIYTDGLSLGVAQ